MPIGNDSNQQSEIGDDLVAVAVAVKTKGLKGELVADLLTDFPQRFADVSRLICVGQNGVRTEVELERYALQQNRIVLKFAGVDEVDSATGFVGCKFAVPESETVPLPPGEFYDWELEGCTAITVSGEQIGRVREVLRTGGVDTLVIEDQKKKDYLVPLAETIVVNVDLEKKLIAIDPPPGLLEL
jgi:16S rRNA processing protein RimM